jgi:hypothetical protein
MFTRRHGAIPEQSNLNILHHENLSSSIKLCRITYCLLGRGMQVNKTKIINENEYYCLLGHGTRWPLKYGVTFQKTIISPDTAVRNSYLT